MLEQVCHTVHETGLYVQVLPEYIPALYQRFHAKKWEKFNSEKVCNISYARIQGKSSLIHHFSNSSLLHEDKRCRPIIFRSDRPAGGRAGALSGRLPREPAPLEAFNPLVVNYLSLIDCCWPASPLRAACGVPLPLSVANVLISHAHSHAHVHTAACVEPTAWLLSGQRVQCVSCLSSTSWQQC